MSLLLHRIWQPFLVVSAYPPFGHHTHTHTQWVIRYISPREATHGSAEKDAEELRHARAGLWPLFQQVHLPASTLPMSPPLNLTISILPLIVHSPLVNASLFKALVLPPGPEWRFQTLSHNGTYVHLLLLLLVVSLHSSPELPLSLTHLWGWGRHRKKMHIQKPFLISVPDA